MSETPAPSDRKMLTQPTSSMTLRQPLGLGVDVDAISGT
jgi:hypothetical protein